MSNPYAANTRATYMVAGSDGPVVPDGTAKEILSWVNNDPLNAQFALDKELDSDKPRKTLADDLQGIIDEAVEVNPEVEADLVDAEDADVDA